MITAATAMSSRPNMNALLCLVEQLKLEASMERIKVSQVVEELQQYCELNVCKDTLLISVPAKSNLFQESRSCALLCRL
nr:heterotrimeric guanine nucleotide-binding protein 3M3 [Dasypus novemcinctus]